ncbi:flagellar type III secretion system pore protein FliP [Sphingomonas flavalba]|uniref:flagellar type III secretion system pore protein FliP n=1 Tax=Sphingomonas flavalba TaxID=2559804 RepID=UPI00109E1E69
MDGAGAFFHCASLDCARDGWGWGLLSLCVPRLCSGWTGAGAWLRWGVVLALLLAALVIAGPAFAQAAPVVPAAPAAPGVADALDRAMGQLGGKEAPMALSLQILILMSLLTVLPSLLLMMTSFTRIIIVLSILRQALGLQQTPPNQVLAGLALFLTLFVMAPTLSQVNKTAIEPYAADRIGATEMVERSGDVLHGFMLKQTRVKDVTMFANIAKVGPFAKPQDVPFSVLLPAFVTSELKTAFQIGFLIFLPFLVIDLAVASILMALGMMMLSPTIISLPFKLLLFVLVDGWALTMGSLAGSFVS